MKEKYKNFKVPILLCTLQLTHQYPSPSNAVAKLGWINLVVWEIVITDTSNWDLPPFS